MIKQIYASLEITDSEVRVLVGEYFNTRFNIIKLTKVPHQALDGFHIVNRDNLKNSIYQALEETSNKVGTKIEKVILVIPPVNFKRIPLKVNVVPDYKGIKKEDVVRALSHSQNIDLEDDLVVINRIPMKYTVNGISSRRIPEKEICDELIVDIDLLCGDKQIAYDYVSLVEECNLEVLNICLSSYAMCKEGVLIEQSLNNNIVLLDVENNYTILSLLSKGRLVSCEILKEGLMDIVNAVYNKYQLPENSLLRLIKYNANEKPTDDVIFAFSKDNKNYNITDVELNSLIKEPLNKLVQSISTMCNSIIEAGNVEFVLAGHGADMVYLADVLHNQTKCEVKIYRPDTLGVRESGLSALYGCFYDMKELADLRDLKIDCVDLLEFDKVVDHKKIDVEGETLTTKIKTLFNQYISKEN